VEADTEVEAEVEVVLTGKTYLNNLSDFF
jgi:hypothetical protein